MPRDFVGSMQLHSDYIVACMDYESYHFEGPYDETPDRGYGGSLPLHKNDLVAKKSWFMFDDECVCLGAGINSTTGFDVNTVVEHRRLVKENGSVRGIEDITVDGELMSGGEFSVKKEGAKTLNVEGFAGFVFPNGENISVTRYEREPDEENNDGRGRPYIEAHIEHGKCPKDASYAYVVVPYATEEKLNREADDIEIISNTSNLQAVYEKNTCATGIVFWQGGVCREVASDSPCLVMTSERNGIFTFSVCDPTQKAKRATVVINKKLKLKSAHDRLTVKDTGDGIKITVDFDGSYARNLVAEFEI